jgi:hypothetical protein
MAFAFLSGLGLSNHVMLAITVLIASGYMLIMGLHKRRSLNPRFSYKHFAELLNARNTRYLLTLAGVFSLGFSWWIQFIRMARDRAPLTLQVAAGFGWGNAWQSRLRQSSPTSRLRRLAAVPVHTARRGAGSSRLRGAETPQAGSEQVSLAIFAAHLLFSATTRLPTSSISTYRLS